MTINLEAALLRKAPAKSTATGAPRHPVIQPVPDNAPVPTLRHKSLDLPSADWQIRDPITGNLMYRTARYEKRDGDKEVLPWIFTSSGWEQRGPGSNRTLYAPEQKSPVPPC